MTDWTQPQLLAEEGFAPLLEPRGSVNNAGKRCIVDPGRVLRGNCRAEGALVVDWYGEPMEEGVKDWQAGKVVLGGCCITGNDPAWHCKDCENAFGKARIG